MEMQKKKTGAEDVKPVPEGFATVTPFLIVNGAIRLIEFMKKAFGARVMSKTMTDREQVMHAQVQIGNSVIMISDTMEGMQQQLAILYLYVGDVDAVFRQAVEASGEVAREIRDEFYGDRAGAIKDEWGNTWWIATHVEDVPQDELERRSREALQAAEQEHP